MLYEVITQNEADGLHHQRIQGEGADRYADVDIGFAVQVAKSVAFADVEAFEEQPTPEAEQEDRDDAGEERRIESVQRLPEDDRRLLDLIGRDEEQDDREDDSYNFV